MTASTPEPLPSPGPVRGARIVFVLGSLELGGSERQVLLLARNLVEVHDARVEVWGFHGPGRTAELCSEFGIPWRVVPLPLGPGRVPTLRRLAGFARDLRWAKPDIVLPYTMTPNVVCGMVWRWTGARSCVWNQRDEGRGRFRRWAERIAVRATPYFVSNSQHGKDFLIQTLGVDPGRVRVIRNGAAPAPAQSDRSAWRRGLKAGEGCFVASMVANLSRFKDHATLLRGWRIVVDGMGAAGRQALLALAGRFDDRYEALRTVARELRLGETVRFLGPVDDVSGLLGATDLGVFSSVQEGCPNAVLECMAAGLAVAATDIPGIREALGEQGSPALAAPKDPEALADRILALACDEPLRARLGAANRRRAETEFPLQRLCGETVELLGKAFEERTLGFKTIRL